jgi:hypothetical protein
VSQVFAKGTKNNLTNIGGILLGRHLGDSRKLRWPLYPCSTDIDSAIIYALVFVGLFLANAGMYYGLDQWLTDRLGTLSFLASARIKHHDDHRQHVVRPGHAS